MLALVIDETPAQAHAWSGGFFIMDAMRYVSHLIENLAHVTGGEDRDACDPAWLLGYVAGGRDRSAARAGA